MAITRVEVKNLYLLKAKFETDLCNGINILIGDNGMGKTTLLRCLYGLKQQFLLMNEDSGFLVANSDTGMLLMESLNGMRERSWGKAYCNNIKNFAFILEKDILEHAKGLLPFIEQKHTGFSEIYKDVLVSAFDVPTKEQTEVQKSICEKITGITDGYVEWDQGTGTFYTVKTDGSRIPFANEASAYKKLGYLGLLISCGRLEPGTILFWDEPENSLNPELIPTLVNILLQLAQNGVQIFIATHSYDLVRYFDIRKDKNIPVLFHRLSKGDDGQIHCDSSPEYIKLPNNHLEKAGEDLYKAVIKDAMDAMGVKRDGTNS